MNNFTGDLRFLSRGLSKYYDKFYNLKDIQENFIYVDCSASVQIKAKNRSFFIGIIRIFNKTGIEKDLNTKEEDNVDLVYSLVIKYLLRKVFKWEISKKSLLREKAVLEVEHSYFDYPLSKKIKDKFLHTTVLRDLSFNKLGLYKLAKKFINKGDLYKVVNINYRYCFNLYTLCLYCEYL